MQEIPVHVREEDDEEETIEVQNEEINQDIKWIGKFVAIAFIVIVIIVTTYAFGRGSVDTKLTDALKQKNVSEQNMKTYCKLIDQEQKNFNVSRVALYKQWLKTDAFYVSCSYGGGSVTE